MRNNTRTASQSAVTHPALFACMIGMVMANLLFVQLTQAADPIRLLPLYALTLSAPLLERFKDKHWYRGLWNVAVLGFLGMLVQHTMSRDLASVLQDGLILAVLCQVHLLNNLRAEQRPDLLFLNSFLIAIIAGYITVDLGFAAAFVLYAPFFVVGLQLLSVVRAGEPLPPSDARAVIRDGLQRSGVLLGLALLAFLFWPRDFQRQAMFIEYFEFSAGNEEHDIGFSETLSLKKTDAMAGKQEVVLTVTPISGNPGDVPGLWRGATLPVQGQDDTWKLLGRSSKASDNASKRWRRRSQGLSLRRYGESKGEVELAVRRFDARTKRLFLPATAQTIELDPRHSQARLKGDGDGTVRYPNPGELYYRVLLTPAGGDADSKIPSQSAARKPGSVFLRIAQTTSAQSAIALAKRLRDQMPERVEQAQIVEHFSEYLREEFPYRMPGDEYAAGGLHEFLTTDAGGHCEFFATALATMLRSTGVPSRVVTGYRSGRWDERAGKQVIYNTDAHAWVEVLDPKRGWYSVDPTPAGEAQERDPGIWARVQAGISDLWLKVTSFDGEARAAAMAWLKAAPGRWVKFVSDSPWKSLGVALGLAAVFFGLRRRSRRATPRSIRSLQTAFAKAGVPFGGSQTPREALDQPTDPPLSPESRATLQAAIQEHESDRYAA